VLAALFCGRVTLFPLSARVFSIATYSPPDFFGAFLVNNRVVGILLSLYFIKFFGFLAGFLSWLFGE